MLSMIFFNFCLKTVLFCESSLYVYAGTHMHMCIRIFRGQRITSGIIPQALPTFV